MTNPIQNNFKIPTFGNSPPIREVIQPAVIPPPANPFFKDNTTNLGFDFPGSFKFEENPKPFEPIRPTPERETSVAIERVATSGSEELEEDSKAEAITYLTGFRDRVNQAIHDAEIQLDALIQERDNLELEISNLVNPPAPEVEEPTDESSLDAELLNLDQATQAAVIKVLRKLEAQGTIAVTGK